MSSYKNKAVRRFWLNIRNDVHRSDVVDWPWRGFEPVALTETLAHILSQCLTVHKLSIISALSFRHRPGLGQCLSAFASCFPVAFLEPEFNKNNKYSVLAKTQDQSVQVQGELFSSCRR